MKKQIKNIFLNLVSNQLFSDRVSLKKVKILLVLLASLLVVQARSEQYLLIRSTAGLEMPTGLAGNKVDERGEILTDANAELAHSFSVKNFVALSDVDWLKLFKGEWLPEGILESPIKLEGDESLVITKNYNVYLKTRYGYRRVGVVEGPWIKINEGISLKKTWLSRLWGKTYSFDFSRDSEGKFLKIDQFDEQEDLLTQEEYLGSLQTFQTLQALVRNLQIEAEVDLKAGSGANPVIHFHTTLEGDSLLTVNGELRRLGVGVVKYDGSQLREAKGEVPSDSVLNTEPSESDFIMNQYEANEIAMSAFVDKHLGLWLKYGSYYYSVAKVNQIIVPDGKKHRVSFRLLGMQEVITLQQPEGSMSAKNIQDLRAKDFHEFRDAQIRAVAQGQMLGSIDDERVTLGNMDALEPALVNDPNEATWFQGSLPEVEEGQCAAILGSR